MSFANFLECHIVSNSPAIFNKNHRCPCGIFKHSNTAFVFFCNLSECLIKCLKPSVFMENHKTAGEPLEFTHWTLMLFLNLFTKLVQWLVPTIFQNYVCYHFFFPDSCRAQLLFPYSSYWVLVYLCKKRGTVCSTS